MKIGVFDSGLGGLFILQSIINKLPQYDYLYLGDTQNLPYGNKSQAQIYKLTKQAVDYLFKNDCQLVILACNTASAQALRKMQQNYLPKNYPDRRILGVIIPTAQEALVSDNIGIIATQATVKSKTFIKELQKLKSNLKITQVAAPLLVPLIEQGNSLEIQRVLKTYLKPFKNSGSLILGCTHYPIIKPLIQKELGPKVKIISQTEIIPGKLADYLKRHPEIEQRLDKKSRAQLQVTKITKEFTNQAKAWFGKSKLKQVAY